MYRPWAIKRHDYIVEVRYDLNRVAREQQTAAQQRDPDITTPQFRRFAKEVGVEQGFSAGEDHPFDPEPLDVRQLPVKKIRPDFFERRSFPDIAHGAPAIACSVGVDDEHRQLVNFSRHATASTLMARPESITF